MNENQYHSHFLPSFPIYLSISFKDEFFSLFVFKTDQFTELIPSMLNKVNEFQRKQKSKTHYFILFLFCFVFGPLPYLIEENASFSFFV